MSRRELKKYLSGLDQEQLTGQFLELYDKFANVKTYFDFVFNPKEEKLSGEARQKILHEYFPVRGKRPKQRLSVAHKYIRHFKSLGVDSSVLTELMLFNLETALRFSAKRETRYDSFTTSMLKSFRELVDYTSEQGISTIYKDKIQSISQEVSRQRWNNSESFSELADSL
ncbi:DUF6155 family protein [Flavobacterium silvaticum]|uniref:Uncharacterized protein n=1 Tax=Flavobacterium silvaticum TaxID=1852020 RepID=A0A972FWK7_9FLAO|nr:DUF6155 family protein [Flavobacterium silvaticum]NMH28970.1 hypothetical protein [Flavobacterium silvaticum]